MRFFLGLDDTGGYYTRLAEGLKSLGFSSTLVNAYHQPRYKFENELGMVEKFVVWLGRKTSSKKRGSFSRFCWIGAKGFSLIILFFWSLPKYDVFIFSGGTTFLFSYDLWLLKLLNKTIIVVYHGSDSRAPYLSQVIVRANTDFDVTTCIEETKIIKRKLKKIERYADFIINNPSAAHLHDRKIINWFCIGAPFYLPTPEKDSKSISKANDSCMIVHAPTRPNGKGSLIIEKAINVLKQKGRKINYIQLAEKPNSEVLETLSNCDFVVDELYSDSIIAGFAAEAASFGKPAIVGMYGYEKIKASIPEEKMIPPVLVCFPDDVESAIEKLIVDKDYRIALGKQAREFIANQWSPQAVAKRFLLIVKNEIPDHWWFEPKTINYLHGWGVTEKRTKELIQTILQSYGVSALQISNKPELEKAFMSFANDKTNTE